MKEKLYAKRKIIGTLIIIGFFIALYWVGYSPCGSRAVAKYNGGYGTFDMKKYDPITVSSVLGNMEPEGFQKSYQYYAGDIIFIIFFGLLQCMISYLLCGRFRNKNKILTIAFRIAIMISILRGFLDFIENMILLYTLSDYPSINEFAITLSSYLTQVKLWCVGIWSVGVIIAIINIAINKVNMKKLYDYSKD